MPAPFTFGNLGRHVSQADLYPDLKLTIVRNFRFLGDKIPKLGVKMFNATNHRTWNRATARTNKPNFCKISITRSEERTIQVGLKIHFWVGTGNRGDSAVFDAVSRSPASTTCSPVLHRERVPL